MTAETTSWVNLYYDWLKDNTISRELSTGWTEIATPFMDRHNDSLIVYLKKIDNIITMSDDGYILSDLAASGCAITGKQRKDLLKNFLNSYGVTLENNELTITATINTFPAKKHMLLQAMLSVNDMFMLGKDTVKSIFIEDVTNFFDEKDIINTPNVKIQGKSGFDYKIDFVIPKSKKKNLPERFVIAINSPRETSIKSALFTWDDIKNNRSDKENNLLVFLNDQKRFDKKIIDALTTYNAKPILWSQRNKFIDDLAV